MGTNFKAQLERDLQAVFHNTDEFADVVEFWIDGTRFKGPVILDSGGVQARNKPSTDHADGISLVDIVMYVPLSLIKRVPKEGLTVEICDDLYTITKVTPELGEVILYLERLTE